MLAFIGAHSLPLAAIALAGYLVLGAVMPIASSKLCGNAGRASRDAAGSISAYALDGLRGLAETVQFAGVSKRSAGLAAQTDAMGSTDRSLHVRSAAVEGLADALVLLTSLAMIATSLGLFAAGDPSFSSAFICSFAYLSSFGPMLAVCRLGTSLQATLASGARVLDLLDEGPQTVDVADGADVSFGGAACERVTFSYGVRGVSEARSALRGTGAASSGAPVHSSACALPSKDDRILDDVSIAFEPGEMVCFTGRSGSGKSTLLKLLMRFWDPTSGAVKMSGRDLRGVNTASLRSSIGYMTQDTHLFVGTIGDNLRIARELVSHRSSTCAFADRFYSVEHGRIS